MPNEGKMYANKIEKVINNNEKIYYSNLKENKDNVVNAKNTKNIYQKINDIFSSRKYIYKADVILTTRNGDSKKRIIGRNSQYLITAENELIPITDVLDIKYQ